MHKNLTPYLFTLAFVICSCDSTTSGKKQFENYFSEVQTSKLTSSELDLTFIDDTFFTQMFEMTYIDSLLIISDKNSTHNLKVVDLNKKLVRDFGKRGRGPNELRALYTKCSPYFDDHQIFLFDYPNYYSYSTDSLKKNNDNRLLKYDIQMRKDNFMSSTYCNGYVIGSLFNKRFGYYDLEKKIEKSKYDYKKGAGAMTNQYNFYSHPSQNIVVGIQYYSEVISFINLKDNEMILNELSWWENSNEQITEGVRTMRKPSNDDKYCFITAATTNDYVYLLFSGKSFGNGKSLSEAIKSNQIFVVDWKGNPIKKYELDKPIRSLAIDNLGKTIYGSAVDSNGEFSLVKFDL